MIFPKFLFMMFPLVTKSFFPMQKSALRYLTISNSRKIPFFMKNGNNNYKIRSLSPEYKPRGTNQKIYVDYLNNPNTKIILGVGPAGSGKTLFACYAAVQELIKGNIQKIIMTRPLVSVDKEDIGFLPGDIVNKMDPWTRPIFDILLEFFSQSDIDSMVHSGVIEISPLAYMRGRTFKNSFIIADEMQNSSPNQMLMMTTRIGNGSKMVITGDLKQSDRMNDNGLVDFMNKIKRFNPDDENIRLVELDTGDVERSPIVSKILDMYESVDSVGGSGVISDVKSFSYKYNQTNKYGSECGW